MRPYLRITTRYSLVFLILALTDTARGQLNFPGFGSKPKSDDQRETKLLHDNLPLALDANDAYPTVPNEDMLGGQFRGRVLPITYDTLTKPLPPGDYIVPMTFICSEHNVHRAGRGVSYTLAPAKGSASKALSTFVWRGMLSGISPKELQPVYWAMEASVPYDKMPANYKKLIDRLIPDMKAQVNDQGWTTIQTGMQGSINRGTKKVSDTLSKGLGAITGGRGSVNVQVRVQMDQRFEQLGRLGNMALDGENISDIITASYPSEQARDQAVFAGQGGQAPPIPAIDGPWSVMVPGIAYMRFIEQGGFLKGDNVLQLRILQPKPSVAQNDLLYSPHFQLAGYTPPALAIPLTPTLLRLFGGVIDDAVFVACVAGTEGVGALGPCEALATAVGGIIAYGINAAVQAPNIVITFPPIAPPALPPAVAKTPAGSKGNSGEAAQRQAEYERIGNICDSPESGGSECSKLSKKIDQANRCINLYQGLG